MKKLSLVKLFGPSGKTTNTFYSKDIIETTAVLLVNDNLDST